MEYMELLTAERIFMLMDYYEFRTKLCDSVRARLDDGQKLELISIDKVNEPGLDGICIQNMECEMRPTFYVEHLYDLHRDGMGLDDIAGMIADRSREYPEADLNGFMELVDFDAVKDRICVRLINLERNRSFLKENPYVEFLDLAAVFYIYMEEGDASYRANVSNGILKQWGRKKEDLIPLAAENTRRLNPVVIYTFDELVSEMKNEEAPGADLELEIPFLAVGSSSGTLGAVYMMDKKLMSIQAREWDSDIVIIPSSVHEVLIAPLDAVDISHINSIINEVNSTVLARSDYLSDHAYIYDRNAGRVVCAG